jgi:hypothetical protein
MTTIELDLPLTHESIKSNDNSDVSLQHPHDSQSALPISSLCHADVVDGAYTHN